jgi:hypothetical protein
MTQYFKFYKPQYNPTGMSGTVGGAISTSELLPRKDALFSPRETSELISVEQYRKVYAKQVYAVTLTGVTVQLSNTDYTGHISFGVSTGTNDTSSSPGTAPAGVSFTGNYLNSITVAGTTTSGSVIPIWIKQQIAANSGDDDFVSFQLRILGTII